ncbi:MAG: dephospho-CoA kinase, partial [Acidimicrobiales bacterium]
LAETDSVAVFSIPILRPSHREALGLGAIVVVDCVLEVAVERLVSSRGMDREDALARIAAQVSREERTGWADFVLDNSSSLEHLDAEVARLWAWITERQAEGS